MLEVDVLRQGELSRGGGEEEVTATLNGSQLATSDDSHADLDLNPDKSSYISELNLEETLCKNSSQTIYVAKSKIRNNMHGQKPYDRLTERERQRLEESNYRRAIRIRGDFLNRGLNLSTCEIEQLLRDEFNSRDENIGHRRRGISTSSLDSCEEFSSSFEDEEDMGRTLGYWYQSVCSEDYFDKSNTDLVRDVMDMEDKIEELQKSLRETRLQKQSHQRTLEFDVEAELEKIRVFKEEIESLSKQNEFLRTENEKLRLRLPFEMD